MDFARDGRRPRGTSPAMDVAREGRRPRGTSGGLIPAYEAQTRRAGSDRGGEKCGPAGMAGDPTKDR